MMWSSLLGGRNIINVYDLRPTDSCKYFYNKASVYIDEFGNEFLISYNTLIMARFADGNLVRFWDDWSATTGRHIKAFCGLNKKQFENLPLYSSADDMEG